METPSPVFSKRSGPALYRDRRPRSFSCGSGGQHVEIIVSRMKKRYNVEVELKAPKVP